MPVVVLEFCSAAVGAGILHLVVEAFPGFFSVSKHPLPAFVENHCFLFLFCCRFFKFFDFQFFEFVAVASGAVGSSFESKIAVEADFHRQITQGDLIKPAANGKHV